MSNLIVQSPFSSDSLNTIQKSLSFSQSNFLTDFTKNLHQQIEQDEKLKKVSSTYFNQMHSFIDDLQKGYAEIKGSDADCRSICVPVQGGIEEAIVQDLQSGAIKKAKAIFLTPLPCTPLRKSGETKGLTGEVFEPSRQYTLDKREETVRKLMKAGCQVFCAYSKDGYDKFVAEGKSDSDKTNQAKIYETAKKTFQGNLQDMPLKGAIAEELVGALYLIEDKNDNHYFLGTQGVQALNAKPAIWKKWLGVEGLSSEAEKRAKAVLQFIEEQGGTTIGF